MGRKYSRADSAQAGEFTQDWAAFLQIANGRAPEILDKRFKRDKREASKGGRELWFINHLRGEQESFSVYSELSLADVQWDEVDAVLLEQPPNPIERQIMPQCVIVENPGTRRPPPSL